MTEDPPVEGLLGRTALVTGAASGIGEACVQRLVAGGAKVVAVDVDSDGLVHLAQRFSGVTPVTCDL
jgi:3-hydroxybutyrate dehydrogenase